MFTIIDEKLFADGVQIGTLSVANCSPTELSDAIVELRDFDPENIHTAAEFDDHGTERFNSGFAEGQSEKAVEFERDKS